MKAWIRLMVFLVTCLFLPSCSIKEDRADCPCVLSLDLSKTLDTLLTPLDAWEHDLMLYLFPSDNKVIRTSVSRKEERTWYDRKVKKGLVGIAGLMGLSNGRIDGTVLSYPVGMQSDRLLLYSETLMCDGEEARTVLTMYKQYSKIRIREIEEDSMSFPEASFDRFTLVAKGNTSGIDILSRTPLNGEFRCKLLSDEDGFHWFCMPRQADRDIAIELYDSSGSLVDKISLGECLTDAGYEWDAESLDDVTLFVDRCSASVYVAVSDWEEVEKIEKTM